jgi:hypothetical protein
MKPLFFLVLAAAPVFAAPPQDSHEHGRAYIDVVQEETRLHVALRLSGMDALGFEHAPRTAAQKQALTEAHAHLRELVFNPACTLERVEITGMDEDHGDHDHDNHDHDGHAELGGIYELRCDAAVKELQLDLFARFPSLEKIQVQAVTATAQHGAVLNKPQTVFRLP